MTNKVQKKILALDGGGLMGIISLGILAEVEAQLRSLHGGDPDFRLCDFFDFIGGTSTGAIIAAGLMMGRSVAEIQTFYHEEGAAMFQKAPPWKVVASGGAFRFDTKNLTQLLKKAFTEKTIAQLQDAGQLPTQKHLLAVMRNATTDSCWPICTNPAARFNDRKQDDSNLNVPLWQLVRASTAAPSYFQPEFIMLGDKEYSFVDGGLTPHNNPALKMYQMATAGAYNMNWQHGTKNMMILSIGTGLAYAPAVTTSRWGAWMGQLALTTPAILMRGASVENDVTCRTIGMCTYGKPIDSELDTMTSTDETKAFTYARYDADLSAGGMEELGLSHDGSKLKMEKVEQIPMFKEIGEKAARYVDMQAHFRHFVPA